MVVFFPLSYFTPKLRLRGIFNNERISFFTLFSIKKGYISIFWIDL